MYFGDVQKVKRVRSGLGKEMVTMVGFESDNPDEELIHMGLMLRERQIAVEKRRNKLNNHQVSRSAAA